jgi:hypothetical protein
VYGVSLLISLVLASKLNSSVCSFLPEAEFLDVIGTKRLKGFPRCYSQSPLLTDFTEFWIYSVYGKFYLKLVRSASLRARQKIRQYFSLFIHQVYALRKSAQSCLQLASLAQCFGEAPTHPLLYLWLKQKN